MFYLTKLLVKLFVKDSDNCDNPKVRTAYGNLSGVCGIILNLLLFGGKLFAGIVSASVSVIADALNNLSDAGSSVVTFLGFKLASRPADREHLGSTVVIRVCEQGNFRSVILLTGVFRAYKTVEKDDPGTACKLKSEECNNRTACVRKVVEGVGNDGNRCRNNSGKQFSSEQ